jgi:chromosome segregation ATPase
LLRKSELYSSFVSALHYLTVSSSCRVADFAQQAADAKSKLIELESKSRAMQSKSNEDQAAYAKEIGSAKKRISELEESLRTTKSAAELAAREALNSYNSLFSELSKSKSQLENEKTQVSNLKLANEQAERRVQESAMTIQAMKVQLAEATETFTKKLTAAASSAQLAESRRITAEKK